MFAAASKPGGAGGVPQSVGKDFADADQGGKLPERKARAKAILNHPSSRKAKP